MIYIGLRYSSEKSYYIFAKTPTLNNDEVRFEEQLVMSTKCQSAIGDFLKRQRVPIPPCLRSKSDGLTIKEIQEKFWQGRWGNPAIFIRKNPQVVRFLTTYKVE